MSALISEPRGMLGAWAFDARLFAGERSGRTATGAMALNIALDLGGRDIPGIHAHAIAARRDARAITAHQRTREIGLTHQLAVEDEKAPPCVGSTPRMPFAEQS